MKAWIQILNNFFFNNEKKIFFILPKLFFKTIEVIKVCHTVLYGLAIIADYLILNFFSTIKPKKKSSTDFLKSFDWNNL